MFPDLKCPDSESYCSSFGPVCLFTYRKLICISKQSLLGNLFSFIFPFDLDWQSTYFGEGIIVPLYRRFVVYPRGASVEEGADVEESPSSTPVSI